MYQFEWTHGALAGDVLIRELAELYSEHYGIWGAGSSRRGNRIRLSPKKLRDWLVSTDSRIAWATTNGKIVGYAIAVQTKVPRYGFVSWVTQLVVHEQHRQNDVGKTLLFTVWRFSDHFAWGLISANPYAVRALEKATRRRCIPLRTVRHREMLLKLGYEVVPYVNSTAETRINSKESRINTDFLLDHSGLGKMLDDVTTAEKPWLLGELEAGWEWFAFTFHDQPQIGLAAREIEAMMAASDNVTKQAYSRMLLNAGNQSWAQHTESEVDFIVKHLNLGTGHVGSSAVDFGCGQGRHALALAARGVRALGLDYVQSFIDAAQQQAGLRGLSGVTFKVADVRTAPPLESFSAGICLYDVIGSYASEQDNLKIISNLAAHVVKGGHVLLSVMNLELTERLAKNWFSIKAEPDKLLELPPSNIMETTGNIFDPNYYLVDRETKIVYRKEQFTTGTELPQELLVRDKRYTSKEIADLCHVAGLKVEWSRYVRAGHWDEELDMSDDRAKEILVLCQN